MKLNRCPIVGAAVRVLLPIEFRLVARWFVAVICLAKALYILTKAKTKFERELHSGSFLPPILICIVNQSHRGEPF